MNRVPLTTEELSPVEFATNVRKREEAFCSLHGVSSLKEKQLQDATAKNGKRNGGENSKAQVAPSNKEPDASFIADTAAKTGKSRDTIKRAKSRGAVKGIEKLKDTAGAWRPRSLD